MAEHCRPLIQSLRDPVGTVIKYCSPQQFVFGCILHEIPNVYPGICLNSIGQTLFASRCQSCFLLPGASKQDACSILRMVDGICIDKGSVYPLLFEPSHIMKQSGQPRNIHVLLRKVKGSCDLPAQSADTVSVFYFQADHVPATVITVRVFLKCHQCFFSVDLHFCCLLSYFSSAACT